MVNGRGEGSVIKKNKDKTAKKGHSKR